LYVVVGNKTLPAILTSVALFTCTTFNNIVGNADIEDQLSIWSVKCRIVIVYSLFFVWGYKYSKRQRIYPCLYA